MREMHIRDGGSRSVDKLSDFSFRRRWMCVSVTQFVCLLVGYITLIPRTLSVLCIGCLNVSWDRLFPSVFEAGERVEGRGHGYAKGSD